MSLISNSGLDVFLLNPPDEKSGKYIREGRCNQEAGVWSVVWPPISLATIGGVLEKEGFSVFARDGAADGMTFLELSRILTEREPKVLIYSTASPSIDNDLKIASFIKKHSPKTKTVAIGTHVTALDQEILEAHPDLDFIIRGEPEATAKELSQFLISHPGETPDTPGISFLNQKGVFTKTKNRELIQNLDDLPHPAWHLFDLNPYRLPLSGRPFVLLTPHRGCPWKCNFCTAPSYYGSLIRTRSVENVKNEIENLKKQGIEDIFFWSDTFTGNKKYVKALCKEIKPLNIRWTCNSRVDTFDLELAISMKEAGCWMLSFGIESGNQKMLDLMKKGATVEQAIQAVEVAKEAGIKVAGHFILGLPGETESSMQDTITLAKKLDLDVAQFYCAAPFPGTELYDQALENGWIDLRKIKGAGADSSQEIPTMELPDLSSSVVSKYKKQGYRQFYLSGKPLKLIISNLKPSYILSYLKNLKRFIRWTNSA